MNLNEYTIESLKSDYLKKYLKDIKHEFCLEEMIPIVWNSDKILSDKQLFLDKIVSDIDNYRCIDRDKLIEDIDLMQNDWYMISECLNGDNDFSAVCFYDENGNFKCFKNYDIAISFMKKFSVPFTRGLVLVDLHTSEEFAYIHLDKETGWITGYSLYEKKKASKAYDRYVDIPNDFKVGDVIKLHGYNEEYVVVCESGIPDKLKNLSDYSVDACVTVVSKKIFDSSRSYKDQIEEIFAKRPLPDGELDIISLEHEHMHLSFVEKVI